MNDFKDIIYIAIIGDIIDSRKLNNRDETQQKLKFILNKVNNQYNEHIASKFMITLGDEFQGLLKDKSVLVEIINEIEMYMHPNHIRFGIGVGEITTEIQYNHSVEIDGPAYNRARNMINLIEKKERKYEEASINIMIDSGEKNKEIDQLINTIFSLCTVLKSTWTTRHIEVIKTYIKCNENQYKTADMLGVAQSTVSKILKKSNYFSYKSAKDVIEKELDKGESYG